MLTADALGRIATGDRVAFSTLYIDRQPDLVRYAGALLCGDTEAALDVVDEAFLSVWREADRFSGLGSAEGWIRRIVRNKAVDWLRSQRERPIASDAEHAFAVRIADSADTPETAVGKSCAARELRAALDRLSAHHREVVWLCYFEERSLSDIAQIVGCPENTVKTRLFHARRLLRNELESLQTY